MFESSAPFLLFDYFRVPYRRSGKDPAPGWNALAWSGDAGRALLWPRVESAGGARAGSYLLGSIPVFGHVVHDTELAPALRAAAVVTPIHETGGEAVAAVRRDAAGRLVLPFDPGELILNYWSESYRLLGHSARAMRAKQYAKRTYYRVRPALPRPVQIALRRRLIALQARSRFPGWPVEPALHDLYELLFGLLADLAGEPLPRIAPWPAGRSWALVLTHDVEQDLGYRHVPLLRDIELRHGVRSSWNLVGRRYHVRDEVVANLLDGGFEVGVHGLYHDGRDVGSAALLADRLPEMHRWAERWQASGFRSPATNRDWNLMRSLGFDYDSSSPDTDPYEPDSGGCCSWLPFFNGDLVELPITLPQDHTLWEILERPEPEEWFSKTEYLASRGGMALLITHPDYMLEAGRLDAYDRFLTRFAADPAAWCALPRDVSAWWRRRAASHVELQADGWAVVGPAADDGAVELVERPGHDAVQIGVNGEAVELDRRSLAQ